MPNGAKEPRYDLALLHALTGGFYGQKPETTGEKVAALAGDLLSFLPIFRAVRLLRLKNAITGLTKAKALGTAAEWGTAAGLHSLYQTRDPKQALGSAAFAAALPVGWAGLRAAVSGLQQGTRAVVSAKFPNLKDLPPFYRLYPKRLLGKYLPGTLRPQYEEAMRRLRVGESRLPYVAQMWSGRVQQALKGAKLTPEAEAALIRALGTTSTQELLYGAGPLAARRAAYAQQAGIPLEHVPIVEQLRKLLLRADAIEQRASRTSWLSRAFTGRGEPGRYFKQAFLAEYKTLRAQGLKPQAARDAAKQAAGRAAVEQARQLFPTHRPGAHTYFPLSEQGSYQLRVPTIGPDGKLTYALPGREGFAKTLAEAEAKVPELAARLGIPADRIAIVPTMSSAARRAPAELTRGAYFSLLSKLERGLELSREELMKILGPDAPVAIRQPFRAGLIAPHQRQRLGVLGLPTEGLERRLQRYFYEHARVSTLSDPLRELGALYPRLVQQYGKEAGWPTFLERVMRDVAGHPRPFEQAMARAMESWVRSRNPILRHFGKHYGGDAFAFRRLSAYIRAYQSMRLLGGANLRAPLTNLTQFSAAVAKLGYSPVAYGAHQVTTNLKKWRFLERKLGIWNPLGRAEPITADVPHDKALQAISSVMMKGFSASEYFLRMSTAIGAYSQMFAREVAAGASKQQAREAALRYARNIVDETMFHYGRADVPDILASPLGALLGQFRTFLLNQTALIFGLKNAKEAVRFFGTLGAMTGVGAVPFVPDVERAALSWFGGLLPNNELLNDLRREGGVVSGLLERAELRYPRASHGLAGLLGATLPGAGLHETFLPGFSTVPEIAETFFGPTVGTLEDVRKGIASGYGGRAMARALPMGDFFTRLLDYPEVRRHPSGSLLFSYDRSRAPLGEQLTGPPMTHARMRLEHIPERLRIITQLPRPIRARMAEEYLALQDFISQYESGPPERQALLYLLGLKTLPVRAQELFRRRAARMAELHRTQAREDIPVYARE